MERKWNMCEYRRRINFSCLRGRRNSQKLTKKIPLETQQLWRICKHFLLHSSSFGDYSTCKWATSVTITAKQSLSLWFYLDAFPFSSKPAGWYLRSLFCSPSHQSLTVKYPVCPRVVGLSRCTTTTSEDGAKNTTLRTAPAQGRETRQVKSRKTFTMFCFL